MNTIIQQIILPTLIIMPIILAWAISAYYFRKNKNP